MQFQVEEVADVEGTQELARAKAIDGAPSGTTVVATSMSSGHGTHGRSWHAPTGGVYLSIVLRDLHNPHLLTLALGNAVADVVELTGLDARIKWVNDILVDGKKVAGILVEGEATGDEMDFVIAGIGLNGNGDASTWPHPLNETATTLEQVAGMEQCIEDLQAALLEQVSHWVGLLLDGRTEAVISAWRQRDALLGQQVGFDPDGDFCTKLLGTAEGIDAEGKLQIRTDEGLQSFATGSVFLQ